jgi:hypothetical protein
MISIHAAWVFAANEEILGSTPSEVSRSSARWHEAESFLGFIEPNEFEYGKNRA